MRFASCLLILSFTLISAPIEAKQAETADNAKPGIRNGFSVTTSYLPTRFPKYDYDVREWGSATVSGFGLGVEYKLSYTIPSSRLEYSVGLGYTFSRIDETGNKTVITGRFKAPGRPRTVVGGKLPDPFSLNTYCETLREYSYAYIPLTLGYRLCSKGNLSIIPYLGLRGKYCISYKVRNHVESATWFDYYFELFNESSVTSEAKRFLMQCEAGVKVEQKNLFLSLGFVRDEDRMFCTAFNELEYRAFLGPFSFNCWQLGLGINF